MKRNKIIPTLLLLAALSAAFTGCTIDETEGVVPRTVPLYVTLAEDGSEHYDTRGSWGTVSDAYIFVFDAQGQRVSGDYYTNLNAISLNIQTNITYTLCAIGNVGSGSTTTFKDVDTKGKLEALTYDLTNWSTFSATGNIVMVGSNTVSAARDDTMASCQILLQRTAAKLDITVGVDTGRDKDGIVIDEVKLYNIPLRTYYVHRAMTDEEKDNTDANTARFDGDAITDQPADDSRWTSSALTLNSSGKCTVYLFENRAGVVSSITTARDKVDTAAPPHATYLEIKGHGTGYPTLVWRVYLGGNTWDNFNIKRNCTYTISVLVLYNNADARIKWVPCTGVQGYSKEGNLTPQVPFAIS